VDLRQWSGWFVWLRKAGKAYNYIISRLHFIFLQAGERDRVGQAKSGREINRGEF
jgi:hypothetical protein